MMNRTLLIVTILLLLGVIFVGRAAAQDLNPQPYYVQPGDSLSSIAFEAFSPETGATDVVYFLFSGY